MWGSLPTDNVSLDPNAYQGQSPQAGRERTLMAAPQEPWECRPDSGIADRGIQGYGYAEAGLPTRPAFDRDHRWLDWHEKARTATYHRPEAIRDKWNTLTNQERRAIAPCAWQRISLGLTGRDVVRQALKKAKDEAF